MKQFITRILLLILLTQVASCAKKETKMKTKFYWSEASSAPLGYPINVYRGGLTAPNGNFTSLYLGTISGNLKWGGSGTGMSRGVKSIPNHLHVIWVSHAENIFYEIDTPLDYDKMLDLFNQGFFEPSSGDDPTPVKENYDEIVVGFAPGGAVSVWLSGSVRQIEVGHYQGKEIVIPASEVANLQPPVSLLFNAEYRHKVMYKFGIVPLEVVKANEGKPVPYGIWSHYRTPYNWYLDIDLPDEAKVEEVWVDFYNGEKLDLFGTSLIETYPNIIPDWLKWNVRDSKPVPEKVSFYWALSDNDSYQMDINFDEIEIIQAFETINKKNAAANICLKIYVNEAKTYASVKLICESNEVWISNNRIITY